MRDFCSLPFSDPSIALPANPTGCVDLQDGKVPKLDKILEDSDEEVLPDQEIKVPEHKVKLIVGAGGEKIKYIQRKSKCQIQVQNHPPYTATLVNQTYFNVSVEYSGRSDGLPTPSLTINESLNGCCLLQIKKSEDELNKGFLEKKSYALPKARKVGDEVRMVTVMLFGNAKECDIAIKMMDEAMENREQKQKQREKEYEKKREVKNRDRQMYHLRHTHDYEALGIPIGTPSCICPLIHKPLPNLEQA